MPRMGTADTVTLVGTIKSNRTRAGLGAHSLWHSSPGEDPINAQKAMCEAIPGILESNQPRADQLEALFGLDQHAQRISTQLLTRYVEGNGRSRSFERSVWVSALRLSQTFYQAYEHFVGHLENTSDVYFLAHANSVIAKLFFHRRIEFLLRFIRYKKRIPEQWKELHGTYRFAKIRGWTSQIAAEARAGDKQGTSTTPEQLYVRILLLEMMNNGQFSPREALWADGWFGQWCKLVHLQSHEALTGLHVAAKGFIVNPEGADGLQRTASMDAGNSLFLDPSPLLVLIDEQFELLQESSSVRSTLTPAERAGQVVLLSKLKTTLDPNPVVLTRRGERRPVALTVQAIIGLSNIIQVLRQEANARGKAASTSEPQTDGITITALDVKTYSPTIDAGAAITLIPPSSADSQDAAPMVWQVKDSSDSGSRLRGKIDDLNRVIPGSLIAIRENESSPWSVTVVRRLRRLMVDYVEIGVEHLGRGPRFVKLVADRAGDSSIDESADSTSRCLAALYLPASERQPKMPIKTLLLPARDFKSDSVVRLLSSNATYTLRLNNPIQQQFEFIWTSFTVIDKVQASSGMKSKGRAPGVTVQSQIPADEIAGRQPDLGVGPRAPNSDRVQRRGPADILPAQFGLSGPSSAALSTKRGTGA